jgi:hypothetical protein
MACTLARALLARIPLRSQSPRTLRTPGAIRETQDTAPLLSGAPGLDRYWGV